MLTRNIRDRWLSGLHALKEIMHVADDRIELAAAKGLIEIIVRVNFPISSGQWFA